MKRWQITIIIVALMTASACGGYSIAASRNTKKINSLKSQLQKLAQAPATASTDNSDILSYAAMAPLGVKFPYSNKPAGLGYTSTDSNTVAFDSSTLSDYANQLDPKNSCGLNDTPGPLGFLSRTTNLPLNNADANTDGLVKQIGNYYYTYKHPKDCSTNSDVVREQKAEVQTILNELKSLQSYKP